MDDQADIRDNSIDVVQRYDFGMGLLAEAVFDDGLHFASTAPLAIHNTRKESARQEQDQSEKQQLHHNYILESHSNLQGIGTRDTHRADKKNNNAKNNQKGNKRLLTDEGNVKRAVTQPAAKKSKCKMRMFRAPKLV